MPDPEEANKKSEHVLRLYITGASVNSTKAISNIKKICEEHLKGNYRLEIIDVYQQPVLAREHQIIALPMLVKTYPLPVRRMVGNMSDTEKVLKGLSLL